jgi:hypothetical protein
MHTALREAGVMGELSKALENLHPVHGDAQYLGRQSFAYEDARKNCSESLDHLGTYFRASKIMLLARILIEIVQLFETVTTLDIVVLVDHKRFHVPPGYRIPIRQTIDERGGIDFGKERLSH